MTLEADVFRSPNFLSLTDYPDLKIPYLRKAPPSSHFRFEIKDNSTDQKFTLFVTEVALERLGFFTEHLKPIQNNPQKLRQVLENIASCQLQLENAEPI